MLVWHRRPRLCFLAMAMNILGSTYRLSNTCKGTTSGPLVRVKEAGLHQSRRRGTYILNGLAGLRTSTQRTKSIRNQAE